MSKKKQKSENNNADKDLKKSEDAPIEETTNNPIIQKDTKPKKIKRILQIFGTVVGLFAIFGVIHNYCDAIKTNEKIDEIENEKIKLLDGIKKANEKIERIDNEQTYKMDSNIQIQLEILQSIKDGNINNALIKNFENRISSNSDTCKITFLTLDTAGKTLSGVNIYFNGNAYRTDNNGKVEVLIHKKRQGLLKVIANNYSLKYDSLIDITCYNTIKIDLK